MARCRPYRRLTVFIYSLIVSVGFALIWLQLSLMQLLTHGGKP